jgi:hypothetical protein
LLSNALAASSTELAAVVMGTIENGGVTVNQVRTSHRPRGVSVDAGPVRVRLLDDRDRELLVWHLESSGMSRETSAPVSMRGFAGVIPVPAHLAPMVRQIAVSTGGEETKMPLHLDRAP